MLIKKAKNVHICLIEDITWGWNADNMYCANCGFTTGSFASMRDHVLDKVSVLDIETHWDQVVSAWFKDPDREENKNPKWKPGYLEYVEELKNPGDDDDFELDDFTEQRPI